MSRQARSILIVLIPIVIVALGVGYWQFSVWQGNSQFQTAMNITPDDLAKLSTQQWQDDLQYLATNLPKDHMNAFHRITSQQYQQAVTEIGSAIPQLPGQDIPVELSKLVAQIGDGHTSVMLPFSSQVYPLHFYWFGDDFRVIQTTAALKQMLGARMIKIGGESVDELKTRLQEIVAQGENRWYFAGRSDVLLSKPEVLQTLGIVTDVNHLVFTLEDTAGNLHNIDLAPVGAQHLSLRCDLCGGTPPNGDGQGWVNPYAHAPLYLQHANDSFWFTRIADNQTVYAIFNSYSDLASQAGRMFDDIDHHPTTRLIIDMRLNAGGDFNVGHAALIDAIKARPALNQTGHLFVISGRDTFSAAMSNVAQFRAETKATIVGEPPGEVPNSYQEANWFYLPNSHLMIHYSTRYYQFLDVDAPALVPDKQIDPNWASYAAGSDTALAWILTS